MFSKTAILLAAVATASSTPFHSSPVFPPAPVHPATPFHSASSFPPPPPAPVHTTFNAAPAFPPAPVQAASIVRTAPIVQRAPAIHAAPIIHSPRFHAAPIVPAPVPARAHGFAEPPNPYAIEYGVPDAYSGVNLGQHEACDGSSVTGNYRVALPDGRIQVQPFCLSRNLDICR